MCKDMLTLLGVLDLQKHLEDVRGSEVSFEEAMIAWVECIQDDIEPVVE